MLYTEKYQKYSDEIFTVNSTNNQISLLRHGVLSTLYPSSTPYDLYILATIPEGEYNANELINVANTALTSAQKYDTNYSTKVTNSLFDSTKQIYRFQRNGDWSLYLYVDVQYISILEGAFCCVYNENGFHKIPLFSKIPVLRLPLNANGKCEWYYCNTTWQIPYFREFTIPCPFLNQYIVLSQNCKSGNPMSGSEMSDKYPSYYFTNSNPSVINIHSKVYTVNQFLERLNVFGFNVKSYFTDEYVSIDIKNVQEISSTFALFSNAVISGNTISMYFFNSPGLYYQASIPADNTHYSFYTGYYSGVDYSNILLSHAFLFNQGLANTQVISNYNNSTNWSISTVNKQSELSLTSSAKNINNTNLYSLSITTTKKMVFEACNNVFNNGVEMNLNNSIYQNPMYMTFPYTLQRSTTLYPVIHTNFNAYFNTYYKNIADIPDNYTFTNGTTTTVVDQLVPTIDYLKTKFTAATAYNQDNADFFDMHLQSSFIITTPDNITFHNKCMGININPWYNTKFVANNYFTTNWYIKAMVFKITERNNKLKYMLSINDHVQPEVYTLQLPIGCYPMVSIIGILNQNNHFRIKTINTSYTIEWNGVSLMLNEIECIDTDTKICFIECEDNALYSVFFTGLHCIIWPNTSLNVLDNPPTEYAFKHTLYFDYFYGAPSLYSEDIPEFNIKQNNIFRYTNVKDINPNVSELGSNPTEAMKILYYKHPQGNYDTILIGQFYDSSTPVYATDAMVEIPNYYIRFTNLLYIKSTNTNIVVLWMNPENTIFVNSIEPQTWFMQNISTWFPTSMLNDTMNSNTTSLNLGSHTFDWYFTAVYPSDTTLQYNPTTNIIIYNRYKQYNNVFTTANNIPSTIANRNGLIYLKLYNSIENTRNLYGIVSYNGINKLQYNSNINKLLTQGAANLNTYSDVSSDYSAVTIFNTMYEIHNLNLSYTYLDTVTNEYLGSQLRLVVPFASKESYLMIQYFKNFIKNDTITVSTDNDEINEQTKYLVSDNLHSLTVSTNPWIQPGTFIDNIEIPVLNTKINMGSLYYTPHGIFQFTNNRIQTASQEPVTTNSDIESDYTNTSRRPFMTGSNKSVMTFTANNFTGGFIYNYTNLLGDYVIIGSYVNGHTVQFPTTNYIIHTVMWFKISETSGTSGPLSLLLSDANLNTISENMPMLEIFDNMNYVFTEYFHRNPLGNVSPIENPGETLGVLWKVNLYTSSTMTIKTSEELHTITLLDNTNDQYSLIRNLSLGNQMKCNYTCSFSFISQSFDNVTTTVSLDDMFTITSFGVVDYAVNNVETTVYLIKGYYIIEWNIIRLDTTVSYNISFTEFNNTVYSTSVTDTNTMFRYKHMKRNITPNYYRFSISHNYSVMPLFGTLVITLTT